MSSPIPPQNSDVPAPEDEAGEDKEIQIYCKTCGKVIKSDDNTPYCSVVCMQDYIIAVITQSMGIPPEYF